jgi:hypothetical protein
MNIEITRHEIESLIHQRLQSGAFTDVEDVILKIPTVSNPACRVTPGRIRLQSPYGASIGEQHGG